MADAGFVDVDPARARLKSAFQAGYGTSVDPTDQQYLYYGSQYLPGAGIDPSGQYSQVRESDLSTVENNLRNRNDSAQWEKYFGITPTATTTPNQPPPASSTDTSGQPLPNAGQFGPTPAPPSTVTSGNVFTGVNTNLSQMLADNLAYEQNRVTQAAPEQTAFGKSIRGGILDQIKKNSEAPSLSDPTLALQSQAYAGAQGRSLNQGREALAERSAAEGMGTGAFDSAIQGSYDRAGQNQGMFDAGLLGDEVKSRRAELQKALDQGAGILSDQEKNDLTRQLGTMDAAIKQLGVEQEGVLGQGKLNLDSSLGTGDLDLRKYLGELGSSVNLFGLNQGNQQFYDKLGLDTGTQESLLNQILMGVLLGGNGLQTD